MKDITPKEEIKNFMNNIVWLREKHGLSNDEMAKILGISSDSLNKIENGELPPLISVDVIFNIQKHFGILPKNQFVKLSEHNNL